MNASPSFARRSLATLLVLAVPASAAPVQESQVLPLGTGSLVVQDDPDAERATAALVLAAGSRFEEREARGAAHLLAHLVAKGADATWFAERGGELEARADVDVLTITFQAAPADVSEMAGRLATRLGNASWDTAAFESARNELTAQLRAEEATAAGRVERVADELVYERFHEYHRFADSASVAELTSAEVSAFQQAHVGTARLCAGLRAADASALAERMTEALAGLPAGDSASADPARPVLLPYRALIFLVDVPDAERTEVRLISNGPSATTSALYAVEAWSWLLGRGEGSSLWQVAAEKDIDATFDLRFDASIGRMGMFRGRIEAAHEDAAKAVELATEAMYETREATFQRGELLNARERHAAYRAAMFADAPRSLARAAHLVLMGLPVDHDDTLLENANTSSAEIVRGGARRYVTPKLLLSVVAGPAEEIREDLEYYAEVIDYRPSPERDPEAVARAEAMVESLGGARAWAALETIEEAGTTQALVGNRFAEREYHSWRELDTARSRRELTALRTDMTTVIDGTPGWSKTNLGVLTLPAHIYRFRGHLGRRLLYSLLKRVAQGDRLLGITFDEEARLVFSDRLGEIARFELDDAARPVRTTWLSEKGERGLIFSRWAEAGDYVYAQETLTPYAFRALEAEVPTVIDRWAPNVELADTLWSRPGS